MKNFIKLTGLILAAALMLASCKAFPKGGTIKVINGQSLPTVATVIKGNLSMDMISNALDDLEENGTLIEVGGTHTFSFDEDGAYTVIAAPPVGFYQFVVLLAGSNEVITVK